MGVVLKFHARFAHSLYNNIENPVLNPGSAAVYCLATWMTNQSFWLHMHVEALGL